MWAIRWRETGKPCESGLAFFAVPTIFLRVGLATGNKVSSRTFPRFFNVKIGTLSPKGSATMATRPSSQEIDEALNWFVDDLLEGQSPEERNQTLRKFIGDDCADEIERHNALDSSRFFVGDALNRPLWFRLAAVCNAMQLKLGGTSASDPQRQFKLEKCEATFEALRPSIISQLSALESEEAKLAILSIEKKLTEVTLEDIKIVSRMLKTIAPTASEFQFHIAQSNRCIQSQLPLDVQKEIQYVEARARVNEFRDLLRTSMSLPQRMHFLCYYLMRHIHLCAEGEAASALLVEIDVLVNDLWPLVLAELNTKNLPALEPLKLLLISKTLKTCTAADIQILLDAEKWANNELKLQADRAMPDIANIRDSEPLSSPDTNTVLPSAALSPLVETCNTDATLAHGRDGELAIISIIRRPEYPIKFELSGRELYHGEDRLTGLMNESTRNLIAVMALNVRAQTDAPLSPKHSLETATAESARSMLSKQIGYELAARIVKTERGRGYRLAPEVKIVGKPHEQTNLEIEGIDASKHDNSGLPRKFRKAKRKTENGLIED